ncbi:MAG: phosphate ABC transporter permease PstA [Prevotellaceae bacterium]|nr:phosphate ABC transporter permease PstA [Prevotellaceae bacterium]
MKINTNTKRRYAQSKMLHIGVCVTAFLSALPLALILGKVFYEGIGLINWQFITQPTPTTFKAMMAINNGEPIPGGIANGIVGTLIMLLLASLIAIPLGVMCGTCLAENRHSRYSHVISYMTDLLQGTPSIIIGIVVYVWAVVPFHGYSALAGSIALCIMMLPLIVRSTEEALKMLPAGLKESSLALGGDYRRTVIKVLLPSASGSIVTGILLAMSRVIGETAPLMFTALGCSLIQWRADLPMSSLPMLIWQFYNDPVLQPLVWGTSLLLLFIVLMLNTTAKIINKRVSH